MTNERNAGLSRRRGYDSLRRAVEHRYDLAGKVVVAVLGIVSFAFMLLEKSRSAMEDERALWIFGLFGLCVAGMMAAFTANLITAKYLIEELEDIRANAAQPHVSSETCSKSPS